MSKLKDHGSLNNTSNDIEDQGQASVKRPAQNITSQAKQANVNVTKSL